ncbi:unnamed protein product [Taenia asiatica]|uniref:DUF1863 domain-containing protein n=1 Tax=Taenia asiatica TaxID=60517 RepID=A0A0R3WH25_TAEAS|nr:unnamed protein product [Taenia asiatica]
MSYNKPVPHLESPCIETGKDIPLSRYPLNVRFAKASDFVIIRDHRESDSDDPVLRIGNIGSNDELDDSDCIIYFVYPWRSPERELRVIVEALAPHQTLVIALIVCAGKDKLSEMDCFGRFIHKIGGFYNVLLSAAPTNWRLWCIRREDDNFINWSDLLEWACYDVISK